MAIRANCVVPDTEAVAIQLTMVIVAIQVAILHAQQAVEVTQAMNRMDTENHLLRADV